MYILYNIYIYIYGCCPIPPLLFDHPAIYKTSWRAGETIALVYNMQKHTRKHMFIVGEKLWASLFSRDSNEHIMLNILTNLQGFTLCFFDCKCKS